MSKITKEQLEMLQQFQSKRNALFHDLGVLESQKHLFLHSLSDLNSQQQEFNAEIEEQYGKITVSLEDGSFELIEDNQELDG